MPRVTFPQVLQRHVACAPIEVEGDTVHAVLAAAFAVYPQLRGYLLEDDGALRRHVAVFVDGRVVRDRQRLSDAVSVSARVDVLQALSGG
jgi:sulfur-carrier protein